MLPRSRRIKEHPIGETCVNDQALSVEFLLDAEQPDFADRFIGERDDLKLQELPDERDVLAPLSQERGVDVGFEKVISVKFVSN